MRNYELFIVLTEQSPLDEDPLFGLWVPAEHATAGFDPPPQLSEKKREKSKIVRTKQIIQGLNSQNLRAFNF